VTTIEGQSLGRLERVDLRNIWVSEAIDFTPRLARSENLVVLAETLNMELELEAQERAVGPFRADILCKDIGTNNWVLIENQSTAPLMIGHRLMGASLLCTGNIVSAA
jgi:hypothetical protein